MLTLIYGSVEVNASGFSGTRYVLGPKLMFAKCDGHYPSRSGQTSLATAVTNFTKPVTKINFRPGTDQ